VRGGDAFTYDGAVTTLLVIAKQPVPGRVKTRLVPPYSLEQAAVLAEAALADTQITPDLLTVGWDGVDAWFGPAADGGFWALGLREPDPDLLRGVPMSTPATCAVQRARLCAAGLRVSDLPLLRDVDTAADAAAVARLAPWTRFAACVRDLAPAAASPRRRFAPCPPGGGSLA
jgi:glycosyltransferase A (GT-A) superfamily protein (DUF2064 family)